MVDGDRSLHVEALPLPGEGLKALVSRLCGSDRALAEVAAANGGVTTLRAGTRYRVPFARLRPEFQLQALQALFPQDVLAPDGWRHRVVALDGVGPLDLWSVAELFTGKGENFRELRGPTSSRTNGSSRARRS